MNRKSFKQFIKEDPQSLCEDILSKAFALAQNVKHDSVSQKLLSTCSQFEATLKRVIAEPNTSQKLNLLTDAFLELTQILRLQSSQSSHIKNVAVAAVVLHDDLNKTLQKHLSRLNLSRR